MSRLTELKSDLRIVLDDNAHLRPLLSSDMTPAYVDGLNDPVVNRFLGQSRRQRQTAETVAAYIEANFRNPHDVLLGLFIDGALRGTVRLHDVNEDTRTAVVGVLIFDQHYWRQRWASRAITAAIDFAVRELGIHTFRAGMVAHNAPSRGTFSALGFQHRSELDVKDAENVPIEYWQLDLQR